MSCARSNGVWCPIHLTLDVFGQRKFRFAVGEIERLFFHETEIVGRQVCMLG